MYVEVEKQTVPSNFLKEFLVSPYRNTPMSHDRESLGICERVPKFPGIYARVSEGLARNSPGIYVETYDDSKQSYTIFYHHIYS
jgi:hypothetical protein